MGQDDRGPVVHGSPGTEHSHAIRAPVALSRRGPWAVADPQPVLSSAGRHPCRPWQADSLSSRGPSPCESPHTVWPLSAGQQPRRTPEEPVPRAGCTSAAAQPSTATLRPSAPPHEASRGRPASCPDRAEAVGHWRVETGADLDAVPASAPGLTLRPKSRHTAACPVRMCPTADLARDAEVMYPVTLCHQELRVHRVVSCEQGLGLGHPRSALGPHLQGHHDGTGGTQKGRPGHSTLTTAAMLRWVLRAPLGLPVVPLV